MRAHPCHTRREFLVRRGRARRGRGRAAAARPRGGALDHPRPTASPPSSTRSTSSRGRRASSRRRGSPGQGFIVPGGGAKVVQALAAGQAMFALGDSNHPLKITREGQGGRHPLRDRHAVLLREHRGAQGALRRGASPAVETLATMKRSDGGKGWSPRPPSAPARGCTASYVLEQQQDAGRQVAERLRGVGRRRRLDDHARGAQGREVRRDHGGAGVDVGRRGPGLRQDDLRHPGREDVEPRLRRAAARHRRLLPQGDHREGSPTPVQGYVNACYRAQKWIQKATDERDPRAALQAVHGHVLPGRGPEVDPVLQGHLRLGLPRRRDGSTTRSRRSSSRRRRSTSPSPSPKAVDMSFVRKASGQSSPDRADARPDRDPRPRARRSRTAAATWPPSPACRSRSATRSSWPSSARPAAASPRSST